MITQSEELFAKLPSRVELCYQTFGEPTAPPLVLSMGLGGPMTWWDPRLIELLVDKGFYVIRYDNRESGRSSRIPTRTPTRAEMFQAFAGLPVELPYSLADMGGDIFALLDHLGIWAAHVVGVSMGGMVVQEAAILAPDRVLSMTSMSATTGRRYIGWDLRLLPDLLRRTARNQSEYVESSLAFWSKVASPAYPFDEEEGVDRALATWLRGINPAGVMRQTLAIARQADRSSRLSQLTLPALAIHGLADRLIHFRGGVNTARAIPGAELLLVPGLGHDLPPALFPLFARSIASVAARADTKEPHL